MHFINCGPTVKYLSGGLGNYAEVAVPNIENVFKKAYAKLSEDRKYMEGVVSPRLLKSVVDEAAFTNDEIAAKYFGGVLASALQLSA